MNSFINKIKHFFVSHFRVLMVIFLILLAIFMLWSANNQSTQSISATPVKIYFEGEYRIADGDWHPIEKGKHIPATQGDVTIRGNFHMNSPSGEYIGLFTGAEYIAFYTDHINLTFRESGRADYVIDHENPVHGESACGTGWTPHAFSKGNTDPIEIIVHNPHKFGNETAIDEMLENVAIWINMDFEKNILDSGETQKNIGVLLILISLVFLGTAIFSTLIHIKNSPIIWMVGLVILFAGIYVSYSATGVSFWSESVVTNTILRGSSIMFYMLFLLLSVVYFLTKTKIIGNIMIGVMVFTNALVFALPLVSNIYFYDAILLWIAVQGIVNIVLIICIIKEFLIINTKEKWLYMGAILPLIAFFVDVFAIWRGLWSDCLASQYLFIVLFVASLILVLSLIPKNINTATKAKELELEKMVLSAQLTESRISTMMSQIRPHFIYNTLGSIEQLCKLDPPKAADLVHNFAKYLRGNFGELDNPKPILISQEMEHVHHYINIENVRFPDMTFTFEMNSDDFHIPALTVQPIVENAIKHGLMKRTQGGTIHVVAYETETSYCVSVVDDGVGFDTSALLDDRKHVGLRNIRERLKVMVNGTLEIESTLGVGTKVLIKIPKEEEL